MHDDYGSCIFAYDHAALARGLGTIWGENTDVTLTVKKDRGSHKNWQAEIRINFHAHKRTWCMYGYGETGQAALLLLRLRADAYFVKNRTNDSPDEWYDTACHGDPQR